MNALLIHPIRKRPLHLDAAHELREAIIGGQLQPGARLVEAELCDAFGISRTPLREAIKLLEAENLLRVLPSRGVYVTVINESDVTDLFEVVSELERLAATLAVQRMTIADRATLRRMHDRIATHTSLMARTRRGRYVALFDRSRWDEAMAEHERIMEAVENRDAAAAGAEMFNHVTRTGAVLRQTLIKEQNQAAI